MKFSFIFQLVTFHCQTTAWFSLLSSTDRDKSSVSRIKKLKRRISVSFGRLCQYLIPPSPKSATPVSNYPIPSLSPDTCPLTFSVFVVTCFVIASKNMAPQALPLNGKTLSFFSSFFFSQLFRSHSYGSHCFHAILGTIHALYSHGWRVLMFWDLEGHSSNLYALVSLGVQTRIRTSFLT